MNKDNINISSKFSENIENDINMLVNELKDIMAEKWQYNENKIYFLKTYLRIIIDNLSSKSNSSFTNDEKEEMINECVCYYLLIWLENAKNAKQTVYSFAKQKYVLKAEQIRHKTGKDILDPVPNQLTALYRGVDVYMANIGLETSAQKKQSAKSKNFIELCFFDTFSNYSLDLYRYLIYRKRPLQNTTNIKEESAVSKAYYEYFSFLKGLDKEKNDTCFTVKSLFFLKFESTMRFLFAYQIAEYSASVNVPINNDVINNMRYYYHRMEIDSCAKGISISPLHRKNEEIIKYAFQTEATTDIQKKIYNSRIIMFDALATFLKISPFSINDNWSPQDFCSASLFLKEDYNVSNIFKKTINTLIDKETQNAIFEQSKTLYLNVGLIDQERLSSARDNLRNIAKSKNKRKKK